MDETYFRAELPRSYCRVGLDILESNGGKWWQLLVSAVHCRLCGFCLQGDGDKSNMGHFSPAHDDSCYSSVMYVSSARYMSPGS